MERGRAKFTHSRVRKGVWGGGREHQNITCALLQILWSQSVRGLCTQGWAEGGVVQGAGRGGYLHQVHYFFLLLDSETGQSSLGESEIGLFALHPGKVHSTRGRGRQVHQAHTLGTLQEAGGYGRCRQPAHPATPRADLSGAQDIHHETKEQRERACRLWDKSPPEVSWRKAGGLSVGPARLQVLELRLKEIGNTAATVTGLYPASIPEGIFWSRVGVALFTSTILKEFTGRPDTSLSGEKVAELALH